MQQVLCIHQNDHGRSGEARGEATRRGGGCVEQMEERGERRSEEGVALLLNFNEFQGEFLLRLLFFFFVLPFHFPHLVLPISYMAGNHCHTNELQLGMGID